MYQNNKGLIPLVNIIQQNNKHIKVIIPTAPHRNISWSIPSEKNISSWYDYYTRYDGLLKHDKINIQDFNDQTNRINMIINNEKINKKNIILAGISQGGTIALNVGLTNNYNIGGIIGIHTILMDNIIKVINNKVPIYLFSGNNDNIYNIKLQKQSIDKFNLNIKKWIIEKNLGHCEYSINENKFILESINNILIQ
tara:strand:- start:965 stop:1552 length:588 start_codon:yes stop_codon:yes gene_type:complete